MQECSFNVQGLKYNSVSWIENIASSAQHLIQETANEMGQNYKQVRHVITFEHSS